MSVDRLFPDLQKYDTDSEIVVLLVEKESDDRAVKTRLTIWRNRYVN